jgi:orotate phosphoribosyltransferase-like protein
MELKDIKKEVEFKVAKKALSLYKQGFTLRQIGKVLKLSHETVRTRLNALLGNKKKLTGLDKK